MSFIDTYIFHSFFAVNNHFSDSRMHLIDAQTDCKNTIHAPASSPTARSGATGCPSAGPGSSLAVLAGEPKSQPKRDGGGGTGAASCDGGGSAGAGARGGDAEDSGVLLLPLAGWGEDVRTSSPAVAAAACLEVVAVEAAAGVVEAAAAARSPVPPGRCTTEGNGISSTAGIVLTFNRSAFITANRISQTKF